MSVVTPITSALVDTDEPIRPGTFVSYLNSPFELYQPYPPAGDQPEAINQRVEGINDGEVPWEESGLTERQVGMMVGNSARVPVIGMALAEALYVAGLTTSKSASRI